MFGKSVLYTLTYPIESLKIYVTAGSDSLGDFFTPCTNTVIENRAFLVGSLLLVRKDQ